MLKKESLDKIVQSMGKSVSRKAYGLPGVGALTDVYSFWLEDEGQTYRIDVTYFSTGNICNLRISHGLQADADEKEIMNISGDMLQPFQLLLEWATN